MNCQIIGDGFQTDEKVVVQMQAASKKDKTIMAKNRTSTSYREALRKLGTPRELRLKRIGLPFLVDGLIKKGYHTVLYGNSGTNKTTITMKFCVDIIKRYPDMEILYCLLDGSDEIAIQLEETLPNNATVVSDASSSEIIKMLTETMEKENLDDMVVVFDTYKKFQEKVNDKGSNTTFLKLVRRFVNAGATVLSIAHTNKDKATFSGTAEMEQDTDGMIRFDAIDDIEDEGYRLVSLSQEERCRWQFVESTYRTPSLPTINDVTQVEYIDLKRYQHENEDASDIEDIKNILGSNDFKTVAELTKAVQASLGLSVRDARKILNTYDGRHWFSSNDKHNKNAKRFTLLKQ